MNLKNKLQQMKEKISTIPYFTSKVEEKLGEPCAVNQRDMMTITLSICVETGILTKNLIDNFCEVYPMINGVSAAKLLAVGEGIVDYLKKQPDLINESVANIIKSYKKFERENTHSVSLGGI